MWNLSHGTYIVMLFSFPTQNVTESDNWLVSYGQRMILNMATIRYLGFLEIFMFCRVTVIEFQICCCLPYFIKIGHAFRLQTHHGGHVRHMMGCDHTSFVQIGPLVDEL